MEAAILPFLVTQSLASFSCDGLLMKTMKPKMERCKLIITIPTSTVVPGRLGRVECLVAWQAEMTSIKFIKLASGVWLILGGKE